MLGEEIFCKNGDHMNFKNMGLERLKIVYCIKFLLYMVILSLFSVCEASLFLNAVYPTKDVNAAPLFYLFFGLLPLSFFVNFVANIIPLSEIPLHGFQIIFCLFVWDKWISKMKNKLSLMAKGANLGSVTKFILIHFFTFLILGTLINIMGAVQLYAVIR